MCPRQKQLHTAMVYRTCKLAVQPVVMRHIVWGAFELWGPISYKRKINEEMKNVLLVLNTNKRTLLFYTVAFLLQIFVLFESKFENSIYNSAAWDFSQFFYWVFSSLVFSNNFDRASSWGVGRDGNHWVQDQDSKMDDKIFSIVIFNCFVQLCMDIQ